MPDDVVENRVNAARIQNASISENDFVQIVKEIRSELKLDRHLFYFSIESSVLPDTLVKMYPIEKGDFLRKLLLRYGSDEQVITYFHALDNAIKSGDQNKRKIATELYSKVEQDQIIAIFERHKLQNGDPLVVAFNNLLAQANRYQSIIPTIRWYGANNQFHSWFGSLITLDLGRSIIDGDLVSSKMLRALWNTLLITLPSLLILIT